MQQLYDIIQNKKLQLNQRKKDLKENWYKSGEQEKQRQIQFQKETEEQLKQQELKNQQSEKEIEQMYSIRVKKKQKKDNNILDNKKQQISKAIDEMNEESEIPFSKEKIIKKLRKLNHPITLFGESDWKRYKRLRKIQEGIDICGQFLQNLKILQQKDNSQESQNVFMKNLKQEFSQISQQQIIDQQDKELQNSFRSRFNKQQIKEECLAMKIKNSQLIYQSVSYKIKCQDVYIWIQIVMQKWLEYLQKKSDEQKNSIYGKHEFATYIQSHNNLEPLLRILKDGSVSKQILDALFIISHLTEAQQYQFVFLLYILYNDNQQAHEKYLELSIGKALWPMGVTMVGIHERKGREQIFSSQIAHILNDDTQRKYLQTIERLITFSEQLQIQ